MGCSLINSAFGILGGTLGAAAFVFLPPLILIAVLRASSAGCKGANLTMLVCVVEGVILLGSVLILRGGPSMDAVILPSLLVVLPLILGVILYVRGKSKLLLFTYAALFFLALNVALMGLRLTLGCVELDRQIATR